MGPDDWRCSKIVMYLILGLYAIFASVFSISKSLVSHSDQILFISGIRMTISGLLLLVMNRLYSNKNIKVNPHLFLKISLIGICLFLIANVFTTWGLKHISALESCIIHNLSPFITFIISYLLLKEKITFRKVLGLILGFLGMIPIFIKNTEYIQLSSDNGAIIPELITLLGVIFFCFGWVQMKKVLEKNNEYTTFAINGIAMLTSGILGLISSFLLYDNIRISDPYGFIQDLILIIFIMNICYSNLYSYLLKRYSATFLSLASFLAPLFSAIFSWVLHGQKVTISFFASVFILIVALFIFYHGDI